MYPLTKLYWKWVDLILVLVAKADDSSSSMQRNAAVIYATCNFFFPDILQTALDRHDHTFYALSCQTITTTATARIQLTDTNTTNQNTLTYF